MTIRGKLFVMVCAALAAGAATTGAGQPPAGAQPQGWAVRASMSNPSAKLYNNAKQKLLDGKQIFTYTISRLDVKLTARWRSTTTTSGSRCSTARCRIATSKR